MGGGNHLLRAHLEAAGLVVHQHHLLTVAIDERRGGADIDVAFRTIVTWIGRCLEILSGGDCPIGSAIDIQRTFPTEACGVAYVHACTRIEIKSGRTNGLFRSYTSGSSKITSKGYSGTDANIECGVLGRPAVPLLVRVAAERVAQHVDQLVGGGGNTGLARTLRTEDDALHPLAVLPIPLILIIADSQRDVNGLRVGIHLVGFYGLEAIDVFSFGVERYHAHGVGSEQHRVLDGQVAFRRGLVVFRRMFRVDVVVVILLRRLDVEFIRLARGEDRVAVVVDQLLVFIQPVGVDGVVQLACGHLGIAEGSHTVVALPYTDVGSGKVGLYERGVIRQAALLVFGSLGIQHVRAVEYGLARQITRGLSVVVDLCPHVVRHWRQQHGKLAGVRVRLDGDGLHGIAAVLQTADPRLAPDVFRVGLLVVERVGIAFVGAILAVKSHVHATGILGGVAGEQREGGLADVGTAAANADGLFLLRGTTDDATHDDGLRLVGKCQSADRVVEVVHTLCRITAVVQEGVTLLLDVDGMFADADGDGELTVLVGGDFLAPFVFHHDIVHTEATALHRIGGVLVIHHALHVEAAVVGKVLRVERECLGRHIQRAGGRRETMGTLRRNQRIRSTLTGKRYAAQGVGAHRVRYGIERQLVGGRRLDIRAAASHDVGVVLVGNIRCLRVVVGPAQRTDVLVEWPVGYEAALRTAHEMAVVLHHVGLSETALEEAYLVDVTVNSLCAVCCRGYGDASRRVGSRQWTVESQLVGGDAAQRVGSHQINLRPAVAVVGKGDMGKLVGFNAVGGLPGVTTGCRRDEVTLGGIIVGEP